MEWWQRVEGWEMLANRKVTMALGPLHSTRTASGSSGSSEWFKSLLSAHVLRNMLEGLKVVLPSYGFRRRRFHEVPEWEGISLPFTRRRLACAPQKSLWEPDQSEKRTRALLQNHTAGLDKSTKDSHCTQGRYVSCTPRFFLKGRSPLPYLPHLRAWGGPKFYTLVLLAKDAAFCMDRSFYTISPSMPGSWAFLWSAHETGGLTPFQCSVWRGRIPSPAQEDKQHRAFKRDKGELPSAVGKTLVHLGARALLAAAGDPGMLPSRCVSAQSHISQGVHGICTRRALGASEIWPEVLLFSSLTQEKAHGFYCQLEMPTPTAKHGWKVQ